MAYPPLSSCIVIDIKYYGKQFLSGEKRGKQFSLLCDRFKTKEDQLQPHKHINPKK